ncbi:MAG: sel1 repeat family protein [Desulfobulbus sp.]|nr:sel1 repeat family protein [Desulfobulbus sp.]
MYAAGQGVVQNNAEAVKWYSKAAQQGDVRAQYNLGSMYAIGQGVERDYAEAIKWFRMAAEQGDANAQYRLGVSYDFGWGVAQNNKEAMKWYRQAAEQGVAAAQYYLGVSYANGQGVERNTIEAVKWYARAADQGHEGAVKALEAMKSRTSSAAQQNTDSLELFGVKLKNATRNQLRAAFRKSPLQVEREENSYWVDLYRSDRALEGSSQLAVGCTDRGQFAFAEYTFPSHLDTQQVQKIMDMVASKYGKPGKLSGNIGLGEVEAIWERGQDMSIKVYSGWPDTTTYLRFSDSGAERQMLAEIEAKQAAQTRRKAFPQSQQAF